MQQLCKEMVQADIKLVEKGDFTKARLAHLLFNPLPMALQDIVMPSIIGAPTWFGTYRDTVVCVECALFSVVFAWAFGFTAFQAHKDDHMCTMNGHWAYSKDELLSNEISKGRVKSAWIRHVL